MYKELPLSGSEIELNHCEKLKLGTGPASGSDFRREFLRQHNLAISPDADDMLAHPAFAVAKVQIEIKAVQRSVADLGLERGGHFRSIMVHALQKGLQLCPPELALQRCLQCGRFRKGEKLHIAMRPIVVSGHPHIFTVMEVSGWLWLTTDAGHDRSFYSADSIFAFVEPSRE